MKHLTHTGFDAGYPICGAGWDARTGNDVHAMYAPLQSAEFRAGCCRDCLRAWLDTYEPDEIENGPEWLRDMQKEVE